MIRPESFSSHFWAFRFPVLFSYFVCAFLIAASTSSIDVFPWSKSSPPSSFARWSSKNLFASSNASWAVQCALKKSDSTERVQNRFLTRYFHHHHTISQDICSQPVAVHPTQSCTDPLIEKCGGGDLEINANWNFVWTLPWQRGSNRGVFSSCKIQCHQALPFVSIWVHRVRKADSP